MTPDIVDEVIDLSDELRKLPAAWHRRIVVRITHEEYDQLYRYQHGLQPDDLFIPVGKTELRGWPIQIVREL